MHERDWTKPRYVMGQLVSIRFLYVKETCRLV